MPDFKNLNWILPSSIDLEEILKKNPPSFNYILDHFYFIIDYLTTASDFEDLDNNDGFINTNAAKLQGYNHNYKKYLEHLLNCNLIQTDKKSIIGKKSTGYRLIFNHKEEKSKLKYIPITKCTLRKKLKKEYQELEKVRKGLNKYTHLTKWFNENLKIDKQSALQKVEELFPIQTGSIRGKLKGKPSRRSKRYKAMVAIDKLFRGDLYYNVDGSVGRFHSNLTNIKRELRQFITYNGKKLVNLDINNSQPLLSTRLLQKDFWIKSQKLNIDILTIKDSAHLLGNKHNKIKTEILSFIMLVETSKTLAGKGFSEYIKIVNSGVFYKKMSEIINPGIPFDKNKMKVMMFMVFFSSNRFIGQKTAHPKKLFKVHFPDVYRVFQIIKRHNQAALAIILQKIESQIIVEIASKRIGLERPNLPIFTIHDSIATTQGNEDYVERVIKETISEHTGLSAKIGKEYWG